MRMYDIIRKKRNGGRLTDEEIREMVAGYTAGSIPDYQMSAMLMAIYFQGMDEKETAELTLAMADSGDRVDLSAIAGIKVDKHSTGGVGDKTTLIVGPIAAACGVKVAKMSGRGLGHTGGTVDKLEAIPGFQTTLERKQFLDIVSRVGIAVIGQSGKLAPADKKLYALRDVTATVESIPLIASSIMSKKLAAGSDCILLDVKTGSGAFMKELADSEKLAEAMVSIGEHAGKKTRAVITNMDIPLGNAIGNALEVIEAVETLEGRGPEDLTRVCLHLAANMLLLAEKGTFSECLAQAETVLRDGSAKRKLCEMVEAQGGDASVLEDTSRFEAAPCEREVRARQAGFIGAMQTEQCGIASMLLGAGRATKEDTIDYRAGIRLKKKYGDWVEKGEVIAVLYAGEEERLSAGEEALQSACRIQEEAPLPEPLIYERGSKDV